MNPPLYQARLPPWLRLLRSLAVIGLCLAFTVITTLALLSQTTVQPLQP